MILALPARAKLNLTLAVTGLLPDGRHQLQTRFQAVDLHDLIEVRPAAVTSLEVHGEAPSGEANLVLKALRSLEEAAGRQLPAAIRLHKRIPAGAGLGGGSSDAAATLRALKVVHGLDVDLLPPAWRLGADVPFFLCGGAADAEGVGERLSPVAPVAGWFAIAWPGFEISTAAVYAAYDREGGAGGNHLERAAHAVEPRLAAFRSRLGDGWQMTGSGAAYFRHVPSREVAQRAIAGLDCWTAVARPLASWC